MKKFLAIALTVVMVLGVASSAMAFSWGRPDENSTDQSFGYKVEVIKFTRSTGAVGSSSFNIDNNATAVNGADVYFAVKVTIPDLKDTNSVRHNARIKVSTAGLDAGSTIVDGDISSFAAGTYYLYNDGNLYPVSHGSPIFVVRCLDTDTAKVSAKITSERDLTDAFNYGSYDIKVTDTEVAFWEANNTIASGAWIATFYRNGDGKVTSVTDCGDTQKVAKLYAWLNAGSIDAIYNAIKNGEMYMTDANIRAAFGFSHKSTSEAAWKANSGPIIVDPKPNIPKTGDSTSVIGFAMIMVAIVAAVAVKKVSA